MVEWRLDLPERRRLFQLIPTGSGAYQPPTSWKREIYRAVQLAVCHTNNAISGKAEFKNTHGCTSIACTIFLTWYFIIKYTDKVSLRMVTHETKESEHHYSVFMLSVRMVRTCRYWD